MTQELEPDENYLSEEDPDFAPDNLPEDAGSQGSEDEDDGVQEGGKPEKRKRQAGEDVEDAGFENSGDEAILGKARKRRKKTKDQHGEHESETVDHDEDDGGGDVYVKTRSMRAIEKVQGRTSTANGPVTVDVDALWAEMTSGSCVPTNSVMRPESHEDRNKGPRADRASAHDMAEPPRARVGVDATEGAAAAAETIQIKRTYNFAGKVHTEEKVVPRDSAEAKLYLESLGAKGHAAPEAEATNSEPKRVPKKAFRSAFEPVTEHMLLRADLDLGLAARLRARELAGHANAKKLNTVEKSRMDWAGYVDKEGIKDELELAGKSKHSYAARQDFLARSDAIRDEDVRRARMAEKA